MDNLKYTNCFKISGKIISVKRKDDKAIVTVLIHNGNSTFFPEVYCDPTIIPKGYRNYVDVIGYAENILNEDKTSFQHILYATSMTVTATEIENYFGIPGNFCPDTNSFLYLAGIIEKISLGNSNNAFFTRYILETKTPDGRTTRLTLSRKASERYEDISVGDKVCAVCVPTTAKKEKNGKEKKYLSFVVFDMVKVKK